MAIFYVIFVCLFYIYICILSICLCLCQAVCSMLGTFICFISYITSGSLCCLLCAVAPSPSSGTPRMTRSNSIPTHEASFELYQASPLGSTLSLAERPKSMIRSGSFRDRDAGDDGETLDSYSTVYMGSTDEISGLVKVASSNPTRNKYITIVALKGSYYALSLFEF